jgi:hypothetical protein
MQSVIITDEVRTYAIFIYEWMGWTSHTEAGGDTTEGQGGTPAFIGFNAGNGTKSFEYKPYSQVLTTKQRSNIPRSALCATLDTYDWYFLICDLIFFVDYLCKRFARYWWSQWIPRKAHFQN